MAGDAQAFLNAFCGPVQEAVPIPSASITEKVTTALLDDPSTDGVLSIRSDWYQRLLTDQSVDGLLTKGSSGPRQILVDGRVA